MAKRRTKQISKRISLAQNFLKNPRLVRRLVNASTIGSADTVYEIGGGRGIITAELARAAKKVITVEKDARLVRHLRQRFRRVENVEIIEEDFLRLSIVEPDYKIFANIPYNITASIVRRILSAPRTAPGDAYLILQKEAAGKFSGCPRETLFSVLAKPFFEFRIVSRLQRTDFEPVPNVDSVLLHIKRRARQLLQREDEVLYRDFVTYGFCRRKSCLRLAFKHVFTYKQWKRLVRDLHFPLNATPTELSFEQWLGLYQGFKHLAGQNKKISRM
jgi:23S rRNA (adenine-N6)-dimethyltransferase